MSNSIIRVVARVIALPGKIEELKIILMELVELTRQEKGCIQYELLQNQANPTEFTFVETWETQSALYNHFASDHLQGAINQVKTLAETEPDIRIYEQVF